MPTPKDFTDSTLWRISAYERLRAETLSSGFAQLPDSTVLPTTLLAELSQLERRQRLGHLLEVVAACMRHSESALIVLRDGGLVWPLTVFPGSNLYHVPRSFIEAVVQSGRDMEVIGVEPPGLRPSPGGVVEERVAGRPGYRSLQPLLWALALNTAGGHLLQEISGHAAYRIAADCNDHGALGGAVKASFERLRSEIAAHRDIARWPGMDSERAARLLNGAYLQGRLIVLRAHRSAHAEASPRQGLLAWWRKRH